MKTVKYFLLTALLILGGIMPYNEAQAQVCTPDGAVGVGIHPAIPDTACVGSSYDEVITFVFPPDTMYGGFTVPFDSFVVDTVLFIPQGLMWECDESANNCTYYTNPPALTRGCVNITGFPQMANLETDSVVVVGTAWITVLNFPISFADSISISLRVCDDFDCDCLIIGREEELDNHANISIVPHPLTEHSRIRFELERGEAVTVQVFDLTGRMIFDSPTHQFGAGTHELPLEGIPPGVALLELQIGGRHYQKRLIKF